jgi:hypothetical protein
MSQNRTGAGKHVTKRARCPVCARDCAMIAGSLLEVHKNASGQCTGSGTSPNAGAPLETPDQQIERLKSDLDLAGRANARHVVGAREQAEQQKAVVERLEGQRDQAESALSRNFYSRQSLLDDLRHKLGSLKRQLACTHADARLCDGCWKHSQRRVDELLARLSEEKEADNVSSPPETS